MAQTIGLALGTGGARGWAHVGVIRALEEANIKIDYLAGTSIGSLVGAVYLAGELDQLEAFAEEVGMPDLTALMDVSFPSPGLIDGDRIRDFIAQYLSDKRLEDTSIPFRCVATNFLLKREVVLQTGLMIDAVRASISIPGIFSPFQNEDDVYLVDGGIINPLPIRVVREMGADLVIAVNLNQDTILKHDEIVTQSDVSAAARASRSADDGSDTESGNQDDASNDSNEDNPSNEYDNSNEPGAGTAEHTDENDGVWSNLSDRYDQLKADLNGTLDEWIPDPKTGINIFDVLGDSIDVMEKRVTEVNLLIDKPDILIEPELAGFSTFDFHEAKTIMPRGYQAAKAMIPKIKEMLDK